MVHIPRPGFTGTVPPEDRWYISRDRGSQEQFLQRIDGTYPETRVHRNSSSRGSMVRIPRPGITGTVPLEDRWYISRDRGSQEQSLQRIDGTYPETGDHRNSSSRGSMVRIPRPGITGTVPPENRWYVSQDWGSQEQFLQRIDGTYPETGVHRNSSSRGSMVRIPRPGFTGTVPPEDRWYISRDRGSQEQFLQRIDGTYPETGVHRNSSSRGSMVRIPRPGFTGTVPPEDRWYVSRDRGSQEQFLQRIDGTYPETGVHRNSSSRGSMVRIPRPGFTGTVPPENRWYISRDWGSQEQFLQRIDGTYPETGVHRNSSSRGSMVRIPRLGFTGTVPPEDRWYVSRNDQNKDVHRRTIETS